MFNRKPKFPLGKVVLGFTIGALSGAVLALLYAPTTGKKLQKKVGNVTNDLLDKVEEKVDDLQATVRRFAKA
jgi:gas vesicle protein